MSELVSIQDHNNAIIKGDVIFIHGLNGDAINTWGSTKESADFWPRWLSEDIPNIKIWSVNYNVSSSAWKGNTMPLSDRATNILALLEANGIGSKPIIFITHSMGGLLAKQLLRNSLDFGTHSWKEIASKTKGFIFLSTPHSGSDIASWLKHIEITLIASCYWCR